MSEEEFETIIEEIYSTLPDQRGTVRYPNLETATERNLSEMSGEPISEHTDSDTKSTDHA